MADKWKINPYTGKPDLLGAGFFDVDTDTPINGVYRLRHGTANFLGNASFEAWLAGTSVAPSGWTLQGDATISRVTDAPMGSYAAQIVFGTANTGELFQAVPCNNNVDYTLTCYVKRVSGSGAARLVAQKDWGDYAEVMSVPLPTDSPGAFRLAALTFKPPAAGWYRFNIRSAETTASTWVVDECLFQESKALATTMTPKFIDDTFDQNVYGTLYFKKQQELQAGAKILGIATHAENTAALAAGVAVGTVYKTPSGHLMVAIDPALSLGLTGDTPEGGFYTCYYAKETLAKGEIVYFAPGGTANHVSKAISGAGYTDKPIGVVYEAVTYTADNTNLVKIVWGGRADVLFDSGASSPAMGDIAAVSDRVGAANGTAKPWTSTPASQHWAEIGHVTSGTAITTNHYWVHLHFN